MEKLELQVVEHAPHGAWVAEPIDWPSAARDAFDEEVVEPFGRAEYWKGCQGAFFKEWDPCAVVEEVAGVLHEAGIEVQVSATIRDDHDPNFCRHVTVTNNSDGCDLVEIEEG